MINYFLCCLVMCFVPNLLHVQNKETLPKEKESNIQENHRTRDYSVSSSYQAEEKTHKKRHTRQKEKTKTI